MSRFKEAIENILLEVQLIHFSLEHYLKKY